MSLRNDIRPLNLTKAVDRVELFIICLNITRLLTTLREFCVASSAPADVREYERENGKVVQIFGKKVVKIYDNTTRFGRVYNIYSELYGCPYVETPLHFNPEERFVERGYAERPTSLKRLVECLYCIVQALIWLHDNGLMHRDIRWENVARRFNGGGRFLLDFDEACRSPCEGPQHRLKPESHAPELSRGKHTHSVDIWGIGYLMRCWDSERSLFPERLSELMDKCLNAEPEKRPSARDCLGVLRPVYELEYQCQKAVPLSDSSFSSPATKRKRLNV